MPGFTFNPNDLHRLNRLMFVARGAVLEETGGAHRTRKKGEGTDFLDYRPYTPGDDFRKVDWVLYGRLRQLFVRLHEAPRQLSVTLLIDTSRSMGFGGPGSTPGAKPAAGKGTTGTSAGSDPAAAGGAIPSPISKLEQAQRIACALGFVALRSGDRVFGYSFSDSLKPGVGPVSGARSLPSVVQFLAGCEAAGSSDLLAAATALRAQRRTRGLVVILSDFLNVPQCEQAITTIVAGGGRVLAVQVLDPIDRGAGLSGNVRLRDSETGRLVDVHVDDRTLARYQQAFEERREQLEHFCSTRGQHYVLAETKDNYLELVCQVLRTRAVVR